MREQPHTHQKWRPLQACSQPCRKGGSFFFKGIIKGCGLHIHNKFTYIVLAERGALDDPPNPPPGYGRCHNIWSYQKCVPGAQILYPPLGNLATPNLISNKLLAMLHVLMKQPFQLSCMVFLATPLEIIFLCHCDFTHVHLPSRSRDNECIYSYHMRTSSSINDCMPGYYIATYTLHVVDYHYL